MDATVYHLRVPREFLRAHTWLALEDVHSYQPLYVEMLFGEGLVLGGGVLAALVHWALGLGAIAAAGAWGRRLGGSAIWAAVIFGDDGPLCLGVHVRVHRSRPDVIRISGDALGNPPWARTAVDGDVRNICGAGCRKQVHRAAGCVIDRRGHVRHLLAGLADSASVVWLFSARLRARWPHPWYIRNAVFTGNPIYPLANRLFGLPHVLLAAVPYGIGSDFLHLLTSPFDLLARGAAFDQGWAVGPAYLALAPLGIAVSRRSQIAPIAAVVIVLWWLVWFFSSPQVRLLLPILPLAAGLASVGISAALSCQRRSLEAGALAVVAVSVLGGLGSAGLYAVRTAKVVLGLESSTRYLEENSWDYPAYENVDRLVPLNASIAVEGANNLYYLTRPARFFLDPTPTLDELRAGGFTHLLKIDCCPTAQSGGQPPALWRGGI